MSWTKSLASYCFKLCVLFNITLVPAYAEVKVTINQQTFDFAESPRLSEVLAPVALTNNWYWPAAKLFRLDTSHAETVREQVLMDIARISRFADRKQASILARLAAEIRYWKLAQRIILPIDYDLARINPAANPKFDAGAYHLLLSPRSEQILIFGAINRTLSLSHVGAMSAFEYLQFAALTASASKQELWLIQPNGHIVKLAKLDALPVAPMPGAMIYVPFSTLLFSTDMDKLNSSIIALAVNRVE